MKAQGKVKKKARGTQSGGKRKWRIEDGGQEEIKNVN
jgi:hypothetical protein